MCGGLNDHIKLEQNEELKQQTYKLQKKYIKLKHKMKDYEYAAEFLLEVYRKEHELRRIAEAKLIALLK
jgi:hypothetical protein